MKIPEKKALLRISGFVFLAVSCSILFALSLSAERDLRAMLSRQKEFALLRDEYLSLRGKVAFAESKKNLMQVKGVVQAVDEIMGPLGMKQKIRSVKPTAIKEMKDVTEEEAEVQIEKADMNEAVNIFYRIENAPMALSVKRADLKTSFENPARLNITMTLALIKQK